MKKKKNPASIVRIDPVQGDVVQRLEARIRELEDNFEATVETLNKKVNILSQALRVNLVQTKSQHDLINDLGLDVPERLRPRR